MYISIRASCWIAKKITNNWHLRTHTDGFYPDSAWFTPYYLPLMNAQKLFSSQWSGSWVLIPPTFGDPFICVGSSPNRKPSVSDGVMSCASILWWASRLRCIYTQLDILGHINLKLYISTPVGVCVSVKDLGRQLHPIDYHYVPHEIEIWGVLSDFRQSQLF